ncbi:hypothetical protein ABZ477_15015 [Microbacterium sp. NPDC019599]|uniref:hypothetical protein n=1 Tax=Microbacterium sp. NPDC019599 TaxID=3154690 RepID=UPI0033DBB954
MSAAVPAEGAPHDDLEARRERADRLKERIYLSFAALAVVLAINAHGHADPLDAFLTLLVTVLGTLLAVFVADIISFTVAHERPMNRAEFRHAVSASFGTLGAIAAPFAFLLLAVAGVWEIETALRASAIALIAALVVIGWVAVRRVKLTWWQRLVALGGEAVLALAVIGLQLLAHG